MAIGRCGQTLFRERGGREVDRGIFRRCGGEANDYYNEYGRFSGSGHKIALKVCDARDPFAPVTHLSLGRTFTERPFNDDDKRKIAALWPALRNAVHGHWSIARRSRGESVPASALNALPMPAFIMRADGHIVFANSGAEELLRASALIKQANGFLVEAGHLGATELQGLFAQAMIGKGRIDLIARDGSNIRRVTLLATSIREVPFYAQAWPRACALLTVLDSTRAPEDEEQWLLSLAGHFRLTAMERLVLRRIGSGSSVEEIAHERGVIPATIRTHLTALFDKTGRRRQSDLVRLVHGR